MILIPVILTIGLFLLMPLYNSIFSLQLGRYSVNFIVLIIGIFGSLIVGSAVGLMFSKLNTRNNNNSKHIYCIIPIVYTLIFLFLALALSNGNYNSKWWGIFVIKNPVFLIFHIVLAFSGFHFLLPVTEIVAYSGFVVGIILYDLLFSKSILQRVTKRTFVFAIAVVIMFTSIISYEVINSGIIELVHGKSTVGNDLTEYDLMRIAPFKDENTLAKLDKPASLQFRDFDAMPRLDGATAAYPVYASFVESVYIGLGEYFEANKNDFEKDVYAAFVSSEHYPFSIIRCSKTGTAYERLIKGEADIIFVAEPSKAHLEEVKKMGDEFVLTKIGSEAFVFFTNSKNPVQDLSLEEIQAIYSGNIRNWREVGGRKGRIIPYQRPENSGSQTVMQNRVMSGIEMLAPTKETYAGGMGDIINRVAGYKNSKNAIGYSFMYYSSEMIQNDQIKYLSINGVKPTKETIINNTYPFTVSVYAVSLKSNRDENLLKFIDWILSEEGQSLVSKTGYISNIN
ncbi:substrate-binding domain-containing protein [Serpentinicella alkaliphila]|nr:substrate-binding domain-containing protein [Serpentinicella alkaliphila]